MKEMLSDCKLQIIEDNGLFHSKNKKPILNLNKAKNGITLKYQN